MQQYVTRNSRTPQSLLEGAGRRGYYRLNTGGSADARQLMLHFQKERGRGEWKVEDNDVEERQQQDLSLNLFDF